MKRRDFIALGLLLLATPLYKSSPNSWDIIKITLNHMFPASKNFSGSSILEASNFLIQVTKDKYFDKKDLDFLINGSKALLGENKNFMNQNENETEETLRIFENTQIGQEWLALVMNYGLEAMLSDPLYGGNKDALGWKSIKHKAGEPRPKGKYAV